MSEGRGRGLPWVGFIALVTGWPFFNLASTNLGELASDDFSVLLLAWTVFAAMSVCVWLLAVRVGGAPRPMGILSSVAVPVLFSYGWFTAATGSLLTRLGLAVHGLSAFIFVVCAAILLFLLDRLARVPRALPPLVTFLLVATFIPLVNSMAESGARHEEPAARVDDGVWNAPLRMRPNIYHIILDGYARADTLRELFNLDTAAFEKSLEAHGFVIARHSTANYPTTYLSLASVLSMGYPVLNDSAAYHARTGFYNLIRGANPVVAGLRRQGYTYVHLGNSWGGSRCSGEEDQCLNDRFGADVSLTEMQRMLLDMTPLGRLLRGQDADLDYLRVALARIRVRAPHYVFAHTLPPHPPYERNADCTLRDNADAPADDNSEAVRAMYRDAVECVNRQVIRLIEEIVAKDAGAVVIVQSDHGSDSLGQFDTPTDHWSEAQQRERFRNFLTVRVPSDCREGLPQDITNVNVMRFVAGCLQGRAVPFLDSRFFIGTYEERAGYGTVVELTTSPR